MTINPNALAQQIIANCEAYDAGIITRVRWDAEQHNLWKEAADAGMASVVLTFVLCPVDKPQYPKTRTCYETHPGNCWCEDR